MTADPFDVVLLERDRMTVHQLLDTYGAAELPTAPGEVRPAVPAAWPPAAQEGYAEAVLLNYPTAPLVVVSSGVILDGWQRVRALWRFWRDRAEFGTSPAVHPALRGKGIRDLDYAGQRLAGLRRLDVVVVLFRNHLSGEPLRRVHTDMRRRLNYGRNPVRSASPFPPAFSHPDD